MITKTKVETFRVDKICNVCKKGNMVATGSSYTAGYTRFDHRCSNPECGSIAMLGDTYPKIIYEPIAPPIMLADNN
jgi:hypothetical protein